MIIEAFNYMFKDNMFKQKALTYFCFAFVGTFLMNLGNSVQMTKLAVFAPLFLLAGAIIMFIPSGYCIHAIKAVIEQNDNYVLPLFNFKHNFATGFKFMVAVLLMSLVFGIGLAIGSVIIAIIAALTSVKIIAYIGIVFLFLAGLILIAYYTMALKWIFATTEAWTSFLQFKKAAELIKKLPGTYNKFFWAFIFINLISAIISAILFWILGKGLLGIAIATLLSVIVATYVVFVNIHLIAKSIKA